ncbi:uncharacterized protein [Macrobrachium rosenbergii]|uniref:uncharacterized protein n=1 Tax=Macrobrachium rosenbergii TaxID=79674 RepID=UPI0034D5EF7D
MREGSDVAKEPTRVDLFKTKVRFSHSGATEPWCTQRRYSIHNAEEDSHYNWKSTLLMLQGHILRQAGCARDDLPRAANHNSAPIKTPYKYRPKRLVSLDLFQPRPEDDQLDGRNMSTVPEVEPESRRRRIPRISDWIFQ